LGRKKTACGLITNVRCLSAICNSRIDAWMNTWIYYASDMLSSQSNKVVGEWHGAWLWIGAQYLIAEGKIRWSTDVMTQWVMTYD